MKGALDRAELQLGREKTPGKPGCVSVTTGQAKSSGIYDVLFMV